MEREYILEEIRRTAAANEGKPLGREAFLRETGIKQTDWYGKYWARWVDALEEAGFAANKLNGRLAEHVLLSKLVELVRDLGRFPVEGEIRLKARNEAEFPHHTTFRRLGGKHDIAAKMIASCECLGAHEDVIAICRAIADGPKRRRERTETDAEEIGFVYLIRSGRFYKIGRTNAAGRRE